MQTTMRLSVITAAACAALAFGPAVSRAAAQQATATASTPAPRAAASAPIPAGVAAPPDYVIGPDDVLSIVFWKDKEMTTDVIVRPDGKVTLPLINDVQASGLTPEQLGAGVAREAEKFLKEPPSVTVVVKAINSRRVFITGQVNKPGPYALGAPTTVLQLIATAGGVAEYAKAEEIVVMRNEGGKTTSHKFNYKDVTKGKRLEQNILLKPGDTIIVP